MINGRNITIKPLSKSNLEKLRRLRNDPRTRNFLTHNFLIKKSQQIKWFENLFLDSTKMYLEILNEKGIFLGIIRCDEWDEINKSIRIGMDIVPQYRGQGIAKDAYEIFLKYLFDDLNLNRVWLLVLDFNIVAKSLYAKLGFTKEGIQRKAIYRNGKFNDYIMMSMLREEYEKKYKAKK